MSLTSAQQKAVAARGNVLVMAGAGTGKTSTLVARCVDCLERGDPPASLDQLLVVTFTEAAAAEARERIRAALDQKFSETGAAHWAQQLALFDTAHIGTLHGFCFKLVRQHFYQLGLDPQLAILDAGEARLLADETLAGLLDEHYAGQLPDSAAVQQLIETHAAGRDEPIRQLILRLHAYSQTRPDPAEWLARQIEMFNATEPAQWREWLLTSVAAWREAWRPGLELLAPTNPKAEECWEILESLSPPFDRAQTAAVIEKILAAREGPWPKGKKVILRKPLEDFFADAEFLASLAPGDGLDPLVEDWNWSRDSMLALLNLAAQFTARFQERKRTDGMVDFHDLEQLALQLLWECAPRQPSAIARHWREKIHFVFVDEYQDINAAQDQIIAALSREGAEANRFLVGDVKQSIYRFRLADPEIFRDYARAWRGGDGQTMALAENFRSRAGILEFVNAIFAALMREEIGGVVYDDAARLIPGLKPDALHVAGGVNQLANGPASPDAEPKMREGDSNPDVEILFRLTERSAATDESDPGALDDLQSAEKEARHIALRLHELKSAGQLVLDRETKQPRPIEWRDMAVLLRAPASKAEGYAKQFERAGVPLEVARSGFYESLEVADLLNLLRLLDNPLQDVPLLAVLRSPLVALSLDELATIRLATKGHFWTALRKWHDMLRVTGCGKQLGGSLVTLDSTRNTEHAAPLFAKIDPFLSRFARWRDLARQGSLSNCLDAVLSETHYADWLRAQARGAQRQSNVHRLLGLAERFDQFQRQGLFRFLRFIEAQQAAGAEPEVARRSEEDAVRLMSIHQSKGLEFPVAVVADLGKGFNFQDLRAEIILDETYGLCPQVKPPRTGARYPSLAHWLARRRQERELMGEELRLLYVAMTRARDRLILTGSMARAKWETLPVIWPGITPRALLAARSCAEWLQLWHAQHAAATQLSCWRELDDTILRTDESAAVAAGEAKPRPELDAATLKQLGAKLAWDYPFVASSGRAAKTSVTALRRQAEAEREEESERLFAPQKFRTTRAGRAGKLPALDVGTAHHRFLQHVSFASVGNVDDLKMEAQRLTREQLLTAEDAAALDLAALAAFWQSELGHKIRDQAAHVKRELPFTARFATTELDEITGRPGGAGSPDEFVVVQGVADLLVRLPSEIWLLDFKTDQVKASELEAKIAAYAPQLRLYARALERIYDRRVTQAWLHFLACGTSASVSVSVGRPNTTQAI